MRWQITALLLTSLLQWPANGMGAECQKEEIPRVVHLPLQRNKIQDPVANDRQRLGKRSGTVQANLDNLVSV